MSKSNNPTHTFVVCAYKESPYLEKCIRSVLKQSEKSSVVISTGTPNDYIKEIAKKYELQMYVNTGKTSIADDWNFAISCVDTDLVTLAHQDDIYEKDYLKYILKGYKKAESPIILFTDYGELRNDKKVLKNKLLVIKRMLLFILRCPAMWNNIFVRRRILSLGSAICCPAVT